MRGFGVEAVGLGGFFWPFFLGALLFDRELCSMSKLAGGPGRVRRGCPHGLVFRMVSLSIV
jgi:hypothetical protein